MFAIWMLDPNIPLFLTPNQATTLNNISVLIGALLLLLSAITTLTGTGTVELHRRRTILVTTYTATFITLVVVSVLAFFDQFPTFLTASGPTFYRIVILTASVVLVFTSALLFGSWYLQNRSSVLYWYLALVLYGLDLFSAVFIVHLGDLLTWATRLALYLSSIYFLLALQSRVSKQEINASTSERWADVFKNDREQISDFFSKMLNGFAYCKVITDQNGRPVDYVYLDVNPAYERNHGLKKEDIIGRKATEARPGIENDPIDLIGKFGGIALNEGSTDFEAYSQMEKKWFHYSAYSPSKGYFILTSEDITERKSAQKRIQEAEERWSTTLSSIGDAVIASDVKGKVRS